MKRFRYTKIKEIVQSRPIETQEELECVCNLHVHYGQGYYLGLPDCKFNGVSSQALQYLMNIHGMIRS